MKNKLILLLLFFFTSLSFSQIFDKLSRSADIFNPNGGLNFNNGYNSKQVKIEGSNHLFESWDGDYILQTTKGIRYNINNLNYNLESKKIESIVAKDSVFELRTNLIDYVFADNNKYKVINDELFQELNTGTLKIYKQYTVRIRDAFVNPQTKVETGLPQYIKDFNYYYYKNNELVAFKLKKKDVLNMLKDKEEEIKKYVSENNISFKDESDVVKIVDYYNKL